MSSGWTHGDVVLTGARGMLGSELAPRLRDRLAVEPGSSLHAFDLDLDIRDASAVSECLSRVRPRTVINAAAYTDVDGCESNADIAHAVNTGGPRNLAAACRDVGARLVHFSTDFVFDGDSSTPYRVDDATHPLSVYGSSKLGGEVAIRESGCAHLIIRTSWLFGPGGNNFVEAILARAASGASLSVVTDQVGCPTLASALADVVLRLLDAGASGTVHFCNAEPCSWHAFAVEIVRQAGYDIPVIEMTSDALDRPAKRPTYSVLDTSSYTDATGHVPSPWRDALARYFREREAVHGGSQAGPRVRSGP